MYVLLPLFLVANAPIASPPPGESASRSLVTDAVLADIHGTSRSQLWLRDVVDEQAVAQGQAVAEIMRIGNENWFVDANIQLLANAAILDH